MDRVIKARLISRGEDGKTAEVVSYSGEGSQKRSVTSHIRMSRGHWMAPNPSIARLNAAECIESGAVEAAACFKGKLLKFEGDILILKEKKAEFDPKEYRKARRKLGRSYKEAATNLAEAMVTLEFAKKAADEVRADVPRYLEFVF